MKNRQSVMYCIHGDCVDVSRIRCEQRFDQIDDIIGCEQLQIMTNNSLEL